MSHQAERPSQISWKGWKKVALGVKEQLTKDHVSIVSAGIAFYFFLAIFPAVAAALSIYGLIMDPVQVGQQMSQLTDILPEQVHQMIATILERQSEKSGASLGWSFAVSMLISLWSANKATKAVFEGVNIAYSGTSHRGFVKRNAVTLLFTLSGIVIGLVAITLVAFFPALIDKVGLDSRLETFLHLLRWPLLGLIFILALACVYRVAPYRQSPDARWTSWGASIATVIWLAGSVIFSFFVSNYDNFDEAFGSFSAVVFLMLWFFLTGFIVLLGAEINSVLERQTGPNHS